MNFQTVTELIPETRYKIKYCGLLTYEGTYVSKDETYRIFKNVTNIRCGVVKVFHQHIAGQHDFYVPIFQRNQIQCAMEQRALQLILKSIVGDDTFTW
jgi:hypothetical protein